MTDAPSPDENGGDEYIRVDLLLEARLKEAREAYDMTDAPERTLAYRSQQPLCNG